MAGFLSTVIDDRESALPTRERFPDADEVLSGEYETIFPNLAVHESTYIVIVTRGHRDDMRVLRWAVSTPACYISMIGSRRKVINVVKELEKEGISRERMERIYAPMGLEIGAISPEEISISVAAEMIAVRRNATGNWRAVSKSLFAGERFRSPVK